MWQRKTISVCFGGKCNEIVGLRKVKENVTAKLFKNFNFGFGCVLSTSLCGKRSCARKQIFKLPPQKATDYVIMVTICDKTNDNGYFMSIKAWALNIK